MLALDRRSTGLSRASHGAASVTSLLVAAMLAACDTTPQWETVGQIPDLMEAFAVDGLAVTAVREDQILLSEGFGVMASGAPYTSTTSCGLYSATKVLASLAYAKLAEDGVIDLDAPLGDYLEDAPDAWAATPFFRLLNHTSGITRVVDKPEFAALAASPESSNEDIYRILKDIPLDYEPGQYSRYRQSGYAVAEMILAKRLGLNFDAVVAQSITEPAGMTNTRHPAPDDDTRPSLILSAGGYETTAQDMARLFLGINSGVVVGAAYWKALMLDARYLVGDYSLGSIVERHNGVLTLGHRGGGARANIRYAPDRKVGVMVCTDDPQNNELAVSLAQMLMHEITSGEPAKMPLLVALAGHENMTGAEVVAAYRAAAAEGARYDLSRGERLLNTIGYSFLERELPADAVVVLSLNTELFPRSANTYDSLGEALLASGDPHAALEQYRKVLVLDPGNANASAMVQSIESTLSP